jgi:integrase
MRAADWLERRNGRKQPAKMPIFAEARDGYLAAHASEWKPKQQQNILSMLLRHAAPLNDKRVDTITSQEIADLLSPIWKGPGSHTGNRVRGFIQNILSYADVEPNPARWDVLRHKLSNRVEKSVSRTSMPYQQVPALMAELADDPSTPARALRFTILTAARHDEVLEATWREFDLVNKVWTIPAERMKMGRQHIVPLSDEALACLGPVGAPDALVFPSRLGERRMAQQTVRELVKGVTVHGFRSSMSTWAEEQDDGHRFARDVIRAALAHHKGDPTTTAYLRSDLFVARRNLLEGWGKYAGAGARPCA